MYWARIAVGLWALLALVLVSSAAPKLNVHIIAHTHDDVGWLKTVDEYFYGANNSIQDAGVQYILDSVIPALLLNPERKFIYVEIAFFERWWYEQTAGMKEVVRNLVAEGRLEFINGGWCMNDEANTHYADIIDQMTEGHNFLFNEFGIRPSIGWHIDPFGHASTQASLFAQMGFNAFFFARIDYQDHDIRNATKELEFVWRASNSLGKETEIFTSVLYDGYGPPDGFAFEWADTPPIQDDPRLFDVNIKQRADLMVAEAFQRSVSFKTTQILMTFGSDFQYQNANVNFKNMDKLMRYINSHPEYGVNIFYSTPSIYVKAVNDEAKAKNIVWSVKTDDFFPYADEAHAYWTGYFTSRPALKGYVRTSSNLLHTVSNLFTLSRGVLSDAIVTVENLEKVDTLFQAMGVAQHHDAVAGTEKQHVADDYAERLHIGQVAVQEVASDLIAKLISSSNVRGAATPDLDFCPLVNVSICLPLLNLASGRAIPIIAVNPLAWSRTEYVRLPVPIQNVEVVNAQGQKIAVQVDVNDDIKGIYTLIFSIDLPPMGFASYVVQRSTSNAKDGSMHIGIDGDITGSRHITSPKRIPIVRPTAYTPEAGTFSIENEYMRVTFSNSTGRMISLLNKVNSQQIFLDQSLQWYNESAGNNNASEQASGAYIFRPNRTETFNLTANNVPSVSLVTGPLVQEVRQVYTRWAYQSVRLYKGLPLAEVEITVGPNIDISDGRGKEVITRYTTDLATGQTWYTDSEGQEMQFRKYNYRPTWKLNVSEPVAGNYYPMNTATYMRDTSAAKQFTIVNDRSQGCGSIIDGEIEVMVHRRLLFDDHRGVGEPLNETEAIRTIHHLFLDKPASSARLQRPAALQLNNRPTLLFASSFTGSASNWFSTYKTSFQPLVAALPPNVHLLTFRTLDTGEVLLRLHHLYAVGEDATYSNIAKVDLQNLFVNLRVTAISEMNLSANMLKSDVHRLQWNTNSVEDLGKAYHYKEVSLDNLVIELKPMDIRTFVIRLQQQ